MDTGILTARADRRARLASERGFLAACALLFIASTGVTIFWAGSMTRGSPMPSAEWPWMPMPGQSWPSAAASFMGMWVVMMVAMMLPSLVPALVRYRSGLRQARQIQLAAPTALAGTGYFFVWAIFGAIAYLLAIALAAAQMQWMDLARWAPMATGAVLVLTGDYQMSPWKLHQLDCCRETAFEAGTRPGGAWRYGLRLGAHCSLCCLGFMAILLVLGVMNLGIMAVVAGAITAERLAPGPKLVARAIGMVIIVGGILAIASAFGVA